MKNKSTAKERLHMSKVASLGCIVCRMAGLESAPEIHHIGSGTMGKRASNYEVIPLCHIHHRTGGHGVAVHSGRRTWEANFGTEKELLAQVMEMVYE